MVEPAPQLIRHVIGTVCAFFAMGTGAQALQASGSCRDGAPHGAYELRSSEGQLRIVGAFNRGKRTSSFIFWTGAGVRIAHIPYDEGLKSGTLSLWYPDARPGREPQQKLEAGYAAGELNGDKRSWYGNGRPRAVYRYENGTLTDAQAWSGTGTPLPPAAARSMAERDRASDERYYASLDAIVRAHPPPCAPATAVPRSAGTAARDRSLALDRR
jgi:hypothetical protein